MSFGLPALSLFPKDTIQIRASGLDTWSKGDQFVHEIMAQFVFQVETYPCF